MNNVLQLLLSPLTKLGESTKEQTRALTSMESILVKWNTASNVGEEIKQQTILLADIKQLLIDQNNHFGVKKGKKNDQKSKDSMVLGDASKFKGLSAKETGGLTALLIGVSVAIVGAAMILQATPMVAIMQLITALAIAGILVLMVPAFVKLGDAFFGSKLEKNTDAKGVGSITETKKGGFLGIAGTLVAILGMLTLVVVASYMLMVIGQPSGMQILTALAIAILFIPLAFAFKLVTDAISKGMGTKSMGIGNKKVTTTDSSGMFSLMGAGLIAILGLLVAVVAASYLLMLIGQPTGMQFLVALGVAIIMIPLAFALGKIITTLTQNKVKVDVAGVKMIGMALLVIITGMIGLVAASYILQMINTQLTMDHFVIAILVGISLIPVAFAFGLIIKALVKAGVKPSLSGVGMIGLAGLAIAVLAAAIVGAAWILLMLPDPAEMKKKIPPLEWSLSVGLSILAFSLSYALILKAMKGATIKEMLLAAAAVVIIGLAILGVAYLFSYLPEMNNAPEYEWTLKVGLALIIFAIPFILIALVMKKTNMSYADMAKGLVGMIAVAAAVFVIAWIFSILPTKYITIPTGWALGTAAALVAIGAPVAALALFIASTAGIGLAGIALAAVGIIIIAIAILAIAWIFNYLPDLGAIGDNLTNFILAPVNGIIDLLVRLKDEVGVDNLIPLAIGIGAISIALLLLAGATAGLAAGGVLGALGNAASSFIDGITGFFGGEKSKGPLDILDELIAKRKAIIELAPAFEKLAKAARMLLYVDSVVKSLNAFLTVLVISGVGGKSAAEYVDDLSKSIIGLKNSFQQFSMQPFEVLMKLFAMITLIRETAEAMGELAKHFTTFAVQSFIAGVGLSKVADAFVRMGNVTLEQLNPATQFLIELKKDTYAAQADALTKMAPAIVTILGTAGSKGKSLLGMLVGEDHPVVAILKALRSASSAIVSMAPAMLNIAHAFHKIAHSPVIAYSAATKFAKVLNDSTFNKQADALERVAKAYKSIAESSNKMNIISIGKTTDMIHALAYLSKNGGEGAVDALGEKLIKAIEDLGNLITELTKGTPPATGPGPVPGPGTAPGKPATVNMQPVVAAITALQTAMERTGIKIKGTPDVRMVKP